MYLPEKFSENENEKIKKVIEQNPLATVLSFSESCKPFINHLPVVFNSNELEEKILIGHMSKHNPQWSHFKTNSECTMIINGASTYITPEWYKSGRDVPTWNYAVVHLYGKMELVESFKEQIEILKKQTAFFEKKQLRPWAFSLPDDLVDESALTSAIVSFRFHIEKVEAKFKLSQNRSKEDQLGIIAGLSERTDDMSKKVREMML